MRDMGSYYEYIIRYVDNLAIISKNAKSIIDALQNTYGFKLKGSGPITYHLGCDFTYDEDDTLCMSPT